MTLSQPFNSQDYRNDRLRGKLPLLLAKGQGLKVVPRVGREVLRCDYEKYLCLLSTI
jgi:hypothetical protein